MQKKTIFLLVFILIIIALFFYSQSVDARSGCCSWHGGVCGCSCCDGSPLSSTCAPYYPHCNSGYEYIPKQYVPEPTPIVIPESIKGGPIFNYNNTTHSYDVTFKWDDWSHSSGWSIALSNVAGADPGPLMDTTTNRYTFKNVYPGTKYVNLKAAVNGYWSRVSYWTIDVPPLPTATPTPTKKPSPTLRIRKCRNITQNKAIQIIKNRKEVKQWLIKGNSPKENLKIQIDREEPKSWIVHVYEEVYDSPTRSHTATFNWYAIDKCTGKINCSFFIYKKGKFIKASNNYPCE